MGFRALLGVPILVENDLIGAIAVGRGVAGPFAADQVELVKTFADQAAIAIANARLVEAVERQRTELARFLSPQVAELISSEHGEQLLAGHRAYISCLFCDLRNFTAFAETAAPEDLFDVLREYHAARGGLIPVYGGTLEHFAGDGVMIFFNDPVPVVDHELQAVRFALAGQESIGELGHTWRKRGADLTLGIGIEAGHVTLGRIGFEGRYDYGAIGPLTNLASRLSTRAAGGQTLIGPRVFGAVEDAVDVVSLGPLELKGFGRAVTAYQVESVQDTPRWPTARDGEAWAIIQGCRFATCSASGPGSAIRRRSSFPRRASRRRTRSRPSRNESSSTAIRTSPAKRRRTTRRSSRRSGRTSEGPRSRGLSAA